MGVFSSILSTDSSFAGLGKPTIKLEFDDNAALLDFQRKMQGGGADAETAEWYDIPSSRETVPAVRGLEGLTQSQLYNYIFTHVEPLTPINIRGLHTRDKKEIFKSEFGEYDENKYYHVLTPIGEVLVNFNGLFNHLVKHATVKEAVNVIKKTLQTPSVIFNSEDLEGNKSIAFIKAFLIDGKPTTAIISSIDRTEHFLKSNLPPHSENYIYNIYKRGGENLLYPSVLDFDRQRENLNAVSPEQFSFEVVEYRLPLLLTENGVKGLNAPGDVYIITDTRKKPRKDLEDTALLKKYDIKHLTGEELQKLQNDDPLLYEQIKSDLAAKAPIKQALTNEDLMQEVDKMLKDWEKEASFKTSPQKLDEPVSSVKGRYIANLRNIIIKYFIDEVQKGNFERVSKIANILGYKYTNEQRVAETNGLISQFVGIVPTLPEGWRISKKIPTWLPKLPKGFIYIDNGKDLFDYRHKIMPAPDLGKTANPYLYNNLDILQHNGMRPTYRILKNYDAFFTDAQHTDQLKGHGLEDTFSLIADVVRNHYKECAKIARWLKGDTKLQTAYNIWHWLHHNVRYEYDRAGREEIRTPLRVWADRRTGVDCDCLAVFVYCCLLCLGYKPQFEVVAFRGKPNYSHIYVNWDGILIDRVWYVFNSPPPFITKKKNFVVNIVSLGKLF